MTRLNRLVEAEEFCLFVGSSLWRGMSVMISQLRPLQNITRILLTQVSITAFRTINNAVEGVPDRGAGGPHRTCRGVRLVIQVFFHFVPCSSSGRIQGSWRNPYIIKIT